LLKNRFEFSLINQITSIDNSTFAVRFAVQLAEGRPRSEDQRIPNLFKMHELARI